MTNLLLTIKNTTRTKTKLFQRPKEGERELFPAVASTSSPLGRKSQIGDTNFVGAKKGPSGLVMSQFVDGFMIIYPSKLEYGERIEVWFGRFIGNV